MSKDIPNVVGTLVGNIIHEPGAHTKYHLFFEAIGRHFPIVGIYDATLRGLARYINALQTIHPNRRRWRERFHQNLAAFRLRSQKAKAYLHSLDGQADIVLQVGVLFDACWNGPLLPSVIYTDYTAYLASENPEAGRSPFTARQLEQWIILEHKAFERSVHICTRSKLVEASIVNDYGIPPEQVTVVGGGVNFEVLPEPVPKSQTDTPTVLFIGKDFYRKGGDLVLQAFALCRSQVPQARLLFLTEDRIPSDLPLEGVELITPTWNRTKIEALYRRAAIFVMPSRLETWGDVFLEAMAYGLPCIGANNGSIGEIIEDGVTGVLVQSEDVDKLANTMTLLLTDPALCYRWGQSGRRRIEREYKWNHVANCLAPVINEAYQSNSHTIRTV